MLKCVPTQDFEPQLCGTGIISSAMLIYIKGCRPEDVCLPFSHTDNEGNRMTFYADGELRITTIPKTQP